MGVGVGDSPLALDRLPWSKELIAGVVHVLDLYGIPTLLWGDSVLGALDKPTALGSFYFVVPEEVLSCATDILFSAGLKCCNIQSSESSIPRSRRCMHYDEKEGGSGHRSLTLPRPPIHFSHPASSSCIGLFPHSSVHISIRELGLGSEEANSESLYQTITPTVNFQAPVGHRVGLASWIRQPVKIACIPRLCEAYAMLCFQHYGTADMAYWLVMLAYIWKYLDENGRGGLAGRIADGEVRDMYLSIGSWGQSMAAKAGRDRFFRFPNKVNWSSGN